MNTNTLVCMTYALYLTIWREVRDELLARGDRLGARVECSILLGVCLHHYWVHVRTKYLEHRNKEQTQNRLAQGG